MNISDTTNNSSQNKSLESFKTPRELLEFLRLEPMQASVSHEAMDYFPLKVTRSFANRMELGNPNDPLLRQILPTKTELSDATGFSEDPVGDHAAAKMPGLLQKYAGRILLIVTGACAIHCRYCFRRSFPYSDAHLNRHLEEEAMEIIRKDPSIREVILSGGDPLSLSNQRIHQLLSKLENVPTLIRLRIHTRLPVVHPDRIDKELTDRLAASRFKTVLVIHANHPNELSNEVASAIQQLKSTGATLLNQSVLLRGVNDHADILEALSERLHHIGVLPYYLHMLDRAKGTSHFEVDEKEARDIHHDLMRRLPGYLVPKLVRENAGDPYKRPV